ncbi:IS5 family transposase [Halosquirtibacter xylanolyticus]|uniref:IS5 family transposase n=1 Tax=Halosquirtibacter xylanolyticus TaxID=3374599 RepID=UPI00374A67C3|nr:IS5 family transposase [Prolixibacteraceae bacterium]
MIRYISTQQSLFEGFKHPFDQELDEKNRWVILANAIPWDTFASYYYSVMSRDHGAPCKDARIVLGALIIKHEQNLSDRDTLKMIQENIYLQYFVGLPSFSKHPVFSAALFVDIRKRVGKDILERMIQAMIISDESFVKKGQLKVTNVTELDYEEETNHGDLKIDASVADADIRFPLDLNLLNKTREESERMIDSLWSKSGKGSIKPRTYRRKARKDYLAFAMNKKGRNNKNGCKKQLRYLRRNITTVSILFQEFNSESPFMKRLVDKYFFIKEIYEQQFKIAEGKKVKDRIVSFHMPFVRPIVRGKLARKTEFGAKINVSISNGFAQIDQLKWNAYNEGVYLKEQVEAYYTLHGYYPARIYADKIYLNRENRGYLKDLNIQIIGKPLGRKAQSKEGKERSKILQKEMGKRNEVEGFFETCKRKYGLNNIKARRQDTSESWIASICLVYNLMKLQRKLIQKFSCAYLKLNCILVILRDFLSENIDYHQWSRNRGAEPILFF